jgi:sirohydrochlorin ferrochelatase
MHRQWSQSFTGLSSAEGRRSLAHRFSIYHLRGKSMHALIIAAHGSRRQASNSEVHAVAERLGQQAAADYPICRAGFLELAEPSIADAIRQAATEGATRVTVVPYLLAAGRHVIEDIPEAVAEAQASLPGLEIRLSGHIGQSPKLLEVLLDCAAAAEASD